MCMKCKAPCLSFIKVHVMVVSVCTCYTCICIHARFCSGLKKKFLSLRHISCKKILHE